MKVFIQNEPGSSIKNFHDEKTLEFKRSAHVSRVYPFPYGFVLDTTADDGLNLDCFVITRASLRTGQIVECEPIGLMEQFEDGKDDHNVLAVLEDEQKRLNSEIKQTLIEFVSHVFDHVSGKKIDTGRFLRREFALEYIAQHLDPPHQCY